MDKPWLHHYESAVPATLSYPRHPLPVNLDLTASRHADVAATFFMGATLTYGQVDALSSGFAAALQGLGVAKGDRVGLYLANSPQFVFGYYGALRAGAIVVPFDPLYAAREVEHQLNDSGVEVLLVLSRFYPIVREVRARTRLKHVILTNIKEYFPPLLRQLFTLFREKREGDRQIISAEPNTYWLQDLLSSAPAAPSSVKVEPGDTAVLLYTGGTTGVPKGAELSHASLQANALQCLSWVPDLREGQEVTLAALPLSHSFGMTTCLNLSVKAAASMLLIPNPRDIPAMVKYTNRHRPTFFPGVPSMYVAFNNYRDIGKVNIRTIRACISGAAALPEEVQRRFQELTGGHLVEGYGLSEASPVTHANPIYGQSKLGTVGLPFPDTEARIVDLDTGRHDLAPGEPGELVIRGPQVMKGYWNQPEETAVALRDGWLFTGDIAVMDEDGYFRIVDRRRT
jgi:long-chain acyl-CoA synthetase